MVISLGGEDTVGISGVLGCTGGRRITALVIVAVVEVFVKEEKRGKWRFLGRESEGKSWACLDWW